MNKNQLKNITDTTINELLNNEIILPSTYFETFSKNALKHNIDLKDDEFSKELNILILDEFQKVEDYIELLNIKSTKLNDSINESKKAIKEKNFEKLSNLYEEIEQLQKEINHLKKDIFHDEITKTFNKKWLYKKFLNDNLEFKSSGLAVLVDILDLNYIKKEYGVAISNNLIVFLINKIKTTLEEYKISFKAVRFTDNELIFFIESKDGQEIKSIFLKLQDNLENIKLRSNSGIIINGNIDFFSQNYLEKNSFKDVFENLYIQRNNL